MTTVVVAPTEEWLRLATSRSVVRRATRVAIVVGTVLILINHAEALWNGDFSVPRLLRIGLTVLVPYCVSTYSSVSAIRDQRRHDPAAVSRPSAR